MKMFNIFSHYGNANQKVKSHQSECHSLRKQAMTNEGMDRGGKRNLIHCWWECKLVEMEISQKTESRTNMQPKYTTPGVFRIPNQHALEILEHQCLSWHYSQ
jgi:hypothetical protein